MQDKLNAVALVCRKYNLLDKATFFQKFSKFDIASLQTAWDFSLSKIQNRDIVKDAKDISINERDAAIAYVKAVGHTESLVYSYLLKPFHPEALQLSDEKIERRVRHFLAVQYLDEQAGVMSSSVRPSNHIPKSVKEQTWKLRHFLLVLVAIASIFTPRVIDGVTPVNSLAERIQEKSKHKFSGAICNDGWTSHSQGKGTCSWHGGVSYYFYKGAPSKSWEECLVEAKQKSWRR